MRETIERPDALVDVTGLSQAIEARRRRRPADRGGGTQHRARRSTARARRLPVLARAILAGASGQIRNMATVGGNILQRTRCLYFYDDAARCNKREPGAGCDAIDGFNRIHAILGASPACVATHPSDMCVALAALDADVHLEGAGRDADAAADRPAPLPGGRPDHETELKPEELITAVEMPGASLRHAVHLPQGARPGELRLCARLRRGRPRCRTDGTVADVRLALGGVAHKPWRAWKAEAALRGQAATPEAFRPRPMPNSPMPRPCATTASRSNSPGARSWPCSKNSREPPHEHRRTSQAAVQGADAGRDAEGGRARARQLDPGRRPDPLILHKHGLIGAAVSRLDGPLKVSGAARFAAEVPLDRHGLCRPRVQHDRQGAHRHASTPRRPKRAPGVVLVMTHRNAPRMKPTPLFMTAPKAAGGNDLPIMQDDLHPLERPGRSPWCWPTPRSRPTTPQPWCRPPMRPSPPPRASRKPRPGHRARHVHGPAPEDGDRRRRDGAGRCAATGRCHLHDATAQPQPDRVARLHGGLGRRRAHDPRRHPGGGSHGVVGGADLRPRRDPGACAVAFRGRRLRHPRPCGTTRCSRPRPPSSPAGPYASCCRARACSGWWAGAASPSSASRSAPGRMAASMR